MDKILVSPSPHLHTKTSTKSLMRDVVIALLPAVVVSVLFYGWAELLVLGVSVASCVLLEYLITKYMLNKPCTVGDMSAVVTGILLALNLPTTTPWWVVFIGAVVAIGVAKMTFGGLGQNLFNPAIVGRVFLLISFPTYMTNWAKPQGFIGNFDAFTGATPLGLAKEGGVAAMLTSSGQAANFYAIMNIAEAGDHIVCSAAVYGGTYNLYAHTIRKMGISATFVDPDCSEEELSAAFQGNTKAVVEFSADETSKTIVMRGEGGVFGTWLNLFGDGMESLGENIVEYIYKNKLP